MNKHNDFIDSIIQEAEADGQPKNFDWSCVDRSNPYYDVRFESNLTCTILKKNGRPFPWGKNVEACYVLDPFYPKYLRVKYKSNRWSLCHVERGVLPGAKKIKSKGNCSPFLYNDGYYCVNHKVYQLDGRLVEDNSSPGCLSSLASVFLKGMAVVGFLGLIVYDSIVDEKRKEKTGWILSEVPDTFPEQNQGTKTQKTSVQENQHNESDIVQKSCEIIKRCIDRERNKGQSTKKDANRTQSIKTNIDYDAVLNALKRNKQQQPQKTHTKTEIEPYQIEPYIEEIKPYQIEPYIEEIKPYQIEPYIEEIKPYQETKVDYSTDFSGRFFEKGNNIKDANLICSHKKQVNDNRLERIHI